MRTPDGRTEDDVLCTIVLYDCFYPDVQTGIYLVLLALIPTLVSDFTLILSVQHVGSTTTAVLGCMEPLTAVGMGVLFLHENFGFVQVCGMLVIFAAVSIVILANSGVDAGKLVPLKVKKLIRHL